MSELKPFLWAQGQQANVKEPIEALREHGWRYGDVPTASNFNWLFKTMTEQLDILQKGLATQKDECSQSLAQQARDQQTALSQKSEELKDKMNRLHVHQNEKMKQLAAALEITWDLLRDLREVLRHYHKDMPTINWPEKVWAQVTEPEEKV